MAFSFFLGGGQGGLFLILLFGAKLAFGLFCFWAKAVVFLRREVMWAPLVVSLTIIRIGSEAGGEASMRSGGMGVGRKSGLARGEGSRRGVSAAAVGLPAVAPSTFVPMRPRRAVVC